MHTSRVQRWTNLLNVLKWPLVFLIVLIYLPLTAFSAVPGTSLLGGMFVELTAWGTLWVTIGFCAAAWSLMFATGLLVEGAAQRLEPEARIDAEAAAGGALPAWASRLFRLPVGRAYFVAANLLAAVGAVIVILHGVDPWWRSGLFALAGGLITYALLIWLSIPVRLAYRDEDYDPLPRSRLAGLVYRLFDRPWLVRFWVAVRDFLSRLAGWLRLHHILEPGRTPPRLLPDHFFAVTNMVGLLVLLAFFGWFFFPPRLPPVMAPAAAFLYVLLLLLIWTLLGLDHHLSRLRISPVLVLVIIMVVVFTVDKTDHYYFLREQPPGTPLTPLEVAAASRAPENLVVVASAGGGILAAGWTTLALQNLVADRPLLADEVRLLSTVSGGSVGAAFYLDALRGGPDLARASSDEVYAFLDCVYRRSVASSLASASYGFAFLDFWRLFVGGWPPLLQHWDRGILLEHNWARNATEMCPGVDGARAGEAWGEVTLRSLRQPMRDGRMPGVILNTTVMETGRRVMQTPITFDPLPYDDLIRHRAQTLSEFIFDQDQTNRPDADPVLWTAARMSATFPYVSPAARAEIRDDWAHEGRRPARSAALHLVDGGYYDNFGIASSLDWLEPILRAKLARGSGLAFRRVLVIQLNPFAASDTRQVPAVPGSVAALFGPIVGLTAIQNGVAITRNKIDLQRFLDQWNARFRDAGIETCLETVEFRPPPGAGEPLSWHLTQAQIDNQRGTWPRQRDEAPPSVRVPWDAMTAFLERERCPGFAPSPPAPAE